MSDHYNDAFYLKNRVLFHKHKNLEVLLQIFVTSLLTRVFHAVDALQQGQNTDAHESVY